MDNLVDAVMKEMEEHEAKFRRSRSLRQPMNDGPLDQPLEEMLRETTPPSTETAAASAAIPQTRPVINNINVSATPSLDSAAASAANTTRAQNSSRQVNFAIDGCAPYTIIGADIPCDATRTLLVRTRRVPRQALCPTHLPKIPSSLLPSQPDRKAPPRSRL
eukprot:2352501-Rhodomonas_salina.2